MKTISRPNKFIRVNVIEYSEQFGFGIEGGDDKVPFSKF